MSLPSYMRERTIPPVESKGAAMNPIFLLGRLIFGGYFAYNGINHFMNRQMLAGYAQSKGVEAAEIAVPASGALILAGGLSVISGMRPRAGLLMILSFLIAVSMRMHRFWEISDPAQQMPEMINFTKNMALVGAALMLMQIPEPWPLALAREEREQHALVKVR